MEHRTLWRMRIYADLTILSIFFLFANQSPPSEFEVLEHLLAHQLTLFYMNRPYERVQSAQGSKVMNNRQDTILNRPRIMGLRANHWPQHWKIVLKVLFKLTFFLLIFSFSRSQQEGQFAVTHTPPPRVKLPTRWVVQTSCNMCKYSLVSFIPLGNSLLAHNTLCYNKKFWWKTAHSCMVDKLSALVWYPWKILILNWFSWMLDPVSQFSMIFSINSLWHGYWLNYPFLIF